MNNTRNTTPLYLYTVSSVESGGVSLKNMVKANEVISRAIDECCIVHPKTTNAFLKGFYSFLGFVPKKRNLRVKLEPVRTYLQNEINCCDPSILNP